MSWNFGDILDALDAALPADRPAVVQGDRTIGWGSFAARSNRLARQLRARGAEPGDKVAFYMRNCPEYLEVLAACFKARLVHVNVNFRYTGDELWHILDNSDSRFVFFGAEFCEQSAALAGRLPDVVEWLRVDSRPEASGAEFGASYEALVSGGDARALDIERSGGDLLFVYTGGTTGMPKGVMWAAEDLWGALGSGANAPANRGVRPDSVAAHVEAVKAFERLTRQIPACPLMHGTGMLTAIHTVAAGAASCCWRVRASTPSSSSR